MTTVSSQALLLTQNKAKCHRRRYAPVGPAGVLFQAQREQSNAKNGALSLNSMTENNNHEEERGIEFTQGAIENVKAPTAGIVFYSRAWVDMLCQLQIVTPILRAYLSEDQRYSAMRRFMPQKFIMIPEILRGHVDWKLPPGKSLLVVVHAIDSRSDTLWVAELLDETGAKISAWIKPRFVEQEQKAPKYVRIGMVWMLKDVTIVLDSSPGRDDGSSSETKDEYKRMLLVGEQNIESVWAPPSNEEDSDTADPQFIQWMEKRNTLTSSLEAAAEDCDLDLFCESEHMCPVETTGQMDDVQEERPVLREHLPPERESPRRSLHSGDDYSSVPLTEFVDRTETRISVHPETEHGTDQSMRHDRQSISSPITRKRKENDLHLGLWSVGAGEELAAFSCDDEDDHDDDHAQGQESGKISNERGVDRAADIPAHADAQLHSSRMARQTEASLPVTSIFQNTDFVSLELDCSSDDE